MQIIIENNNNQSKKKAQKLIYSKCNMQRANTRSQRRKHNTEALQKSSSSYEPYNIT
jgi:hypothetical protein